MMLFALNNYNMSIYSNGGHNCMLNKIDLFEILNTYIPTRIPKTFIFIEV